MLCCFLVHLLGLYISNVCLLEKTYCGNCCFSDRDQAEGWEWRHLVSAGVDAVLRESLNSKLKSKVVLVWKNIVMLLWLQKVKLIQFGGIV